MVPRVLVTCAGGTMMPDLLTHLRQDAVLAPYLVGVDASDKACGRYYADAFYQVPWADNEGYFQAIAAVVEREKVDLVVPCSDLEAFVLSGFREQLATQGAQVLASPPAVLNLIRDKASTYSILDAAGIRLPAYRCVRDVHGLLDAIEEYGYPGKSVVVKPVAGRGGRGMRLLIGSGLNPPQWIGGGARESRLPVPPSAPDAQSWFADGELMIMSMLSAPAYDVDVFAHNGKARLALVRQRYNPAGIPFTGNRIVADPDIAAYCLQIAEALGLDALHDIDLMTDDQGRPCLLEVNPRPSGSIVAAHAAGYPVMTCAIAETLGIPYEMLLPRSDIDIGVAPRALIMPARGSQQADTTSCFLKNGPEASDAHRDLQYNAP